MDKMTPSAEERAKIIFWPYSGGGMKRAAIAELEQAYRDGAAAERAAILALLKEPSEEFADEIAEKFDEVFLPAAREVAKKYGRPDVHPAFAAWGPTFLRALADAIEARINGGSDANN